VYHPEIVEKARLKLENHFKLELPYWTYPQVQEFSHRLKGKFDEEGKQLGALAPEEEHFILSSRLLSKVDFRFFLTRFCLILSDEKRLVPVVPWPSQEKVLKVMAEEELRQEGFGVAKIPLVLLKSRQVGGTVLGEALVAHMVFLNPNTQGLIASDHPDTSLNLYHVLTRMYDSMPPWFRPKAEGRVKGTHLHFHEIDSDVLVGAGNQRTTMGQGMNIDVCHLTELSTWEFPSYIDEDLMPAFTSSRKHHSVILMESTGAGAKGNWFYEHFMAAWKKQTSFKALFAAWYLRPNNRLNSAGFEFLPHTLNMAERVKKETGEELDREQLAFYQLTRRDFEAKGDLEKFYQEYPSTVEEAFQTGVKSCFSLELRAKLRDAVKRPVFVGEVNLATQKLIKVDIEDYVKSEDPFKSFNRLVIWELPKPGNIYVTSVDASHGLAQDNAAIEVIRVGNRRKQDEQVAEWAGNLPPGDLAVVAAVIGRIYRDKGSDLDCLLAVESNPGSPGTTTQLVLQQLGYNNLYIDHNPHSTRGNYKDRYGWWTTTGTRPLLINTLLEFLGKGEVQVNSPDLIQEMGSFVRTQTPGGRIHIAAFDGYHDDRLIALGIALFVAHEDDVVNMAEERRRHATAKERQGTGLRPIQQIRDLAATMGHDDTVEGLYQKALDSARELNPNG
jgi:hypothetical protein